MPPDPYTLTCCSALGQPRGGDAQGSCSLPGACWDAEAVSPGPRGPGTGALCSTWRKDPVYALCL